MSYYNYSVDKNIKVLYICGTGRSGSTILGDVLNEVSGFFHLGEMRRFWQVSVIEQRLCGCGKPPAECKIWGLVIEKTLDRLGRPSVKRLYELENAIPTHSSILLSLVSNYELLLDECYSHATESLYHVISESVSEEILVDSTKLPDHAHTLASIDTLDVYLLHLIRDPRAVAFSWQRKRKRTDVFENHERMGIRWGPNRIVRLWNGYHVISELLGRQRLAGYMRVRYEDFVASPRDTISRIVGFVGMGEDVIPVTKDGEVYLGTSHAVWGNPSRTRTGRTMLELDDEWVGRIENRDYFVTTVGTLPLLVWYGYPLGKALPEEVD